MKASLLTLLLGMVGGFVQAETGWLFLDNGKVRIGVDTNAGAAIGFFAESKNGRNLLNHYDKGRFLQQSWYGRRDGSLWNKKPWVWNPVQGGSWRGAPAALLSVESTGASLHARLQPRHWAAGTLLTNVVMEESIQLSNRVAHIRFRMRYHGDEQHPPTSQEMPAVFIDAALANFVYYKGDRPWMGGDLTRCVPTWPNQHDALDEGWAAYVDDRGHGIGAFSPGMKRMTFYRHPGPTGPAGSGCSYFAPVTRLSIGPGFDHGYSVYLTIGTVVEIRDRFRVIHEERANQDDGGR